MIFCPTPGYTFQKKEVERGSKTRNMLFEEDLFVSTEYIKLKVKWQWKS